MAWELTVTMRFEHVWEIPDQGEIETAFDCDVIWETYEVEEV